MNYSAPAERWTEALPVGNRRLGATEVGGIVQERLALNETTLWSGEPRDWSRDVAPKPRRRAPSAARRARRVADRQREGLRARGGFELDLAWKDGKLTSATIRRVAGSGAAKLRYGDSATEFSLERGEAKTLNNLLNAP